MELKLKNKHKLALDRLLVAADDNNGIPNCFVLSKEEYSMLLIEITTLEQHVLEHIKVIVPQNHESSFKINKKIRSAKCLDPQEVIELVALWVKNVYNITYKDVPILNKVPGDQILDWES